MRKIIFCFLIILILFSTVACNSANDRLTIKEVQKNFDSLTHSSFLVTIGNASSYDNVDTLSQMLCFNEWKKADEAQNQTLRLVVEISEEYEIRIYESYICVYDGYALIGQSDCEYYAINEKMAKEITNYIALKNV